MMPAGVVERGRESEVKVRWADGEIVPRRSSFRRDTNSENLVIDVHFVR